MTPPALSGWEHLRHGGLLLDPPRLRRIAEHVPPALPWFIEDQLRRSANALRSGNQTASEFVTFVLRDVCDFRDERGTWLRGSSIGAEWSRPSFTGAAIKPRQLWRAERGGVLPVFIDASARIGLGHGRKAASEVVHWLRSGTERLAVLTNGRQWRLIFAGLDFDAFCEWDIDLWFSEGRLSPQVDALRTLLSPALWIHSGQDDTSPLIAAILDSRKGQAELSTLLGEREFLHRLPANLPQRLLSRPPRPPDGTAVSGCVGTGPHSDPCDPRTESDCCGTRRRATGQPRRATLAAHAP